MSGVLHKVLEPYDKIQKIIHMLTADSLKFRILYTCDTVADQCGPPYTELLKHINDAEILWGDDTGWFFNKKHRYVWAFISEYAALYRLSASKSKAVAEAILEGFEGVIIVDSHPAWNDWHRETEVPAALSKTYKILADSNSAESASPFNSLHPALKSAIKSGVKYTAKDSEAPQSAITRLQNRIDAD